MEDKKPEEDIEFDFSKIKNIFKRKGSSKKVHPEVIPAKEQSHTTHTEKKAIEHKEEDTPIDFSKVKHFFKNLPKKKSHKCVSVNTYLSISLFFGVRYVWVPGFRVVSD